MRKQLTPKNIIPKLRASIGLAGLLCLIYMLTSIPDQGNMNRKVVLFLLICYSVILLDGIVSFIDIALRERDSTFKGYILWILGFGMFHISTTFFVLGILYFDQSLSPKVFSLSVSGLIGYISLYKLFIEYVDKNIDNWKA